MSFTEVQEGLQFRGESCSLHLLVLHVCLMIIHEKVSQAGAHDLLSLASFTLLSVYESSNSHTLVCDKLLQV